jgi:hypothetical protein
MVVWRRANTMLANIIHGDPSHESTPLPRRPRRGGLYFCVKRAKNKGRVLSAAPRLGMFQQQPFSFQRRIGPPARGSSCKIARNIDPPASLIEASDPVGFSALHEGSRQAAGAGPLPCGISARYQLDGPNLRWGQCSARIYSWTVPMWLSWIGLVVAEGLSYFGISLAMRG